jgi:hypothetical protein
MYWGCNKSNHNLFCDDEQFANIFNRGWGAITICFWTRLISPIFICRQIYDETRLLPYSLNKFAFVSLRDQKWIKALSTDQRSAVTTLYFQIHDTAPFTTNQGQQILDTLPNLKFVGCVFKVRGASLSGEGHDQLEQLASFQQIASQRGIKLVVTSKDQQVIVALR